MPLPTLPDRKSGLNVTVLDFGGTNVFGDYRTYNHNFDITTQDGKGIADRYARHQAVKRKRQFTIDLFGNDGVTGRRVSNLNLSAWSVGGTSRIGDVKNATVTVTTITKEGSGARDFDEYPVAVGTDIEITASEFVSDDADLVLIGSQSTALANFELAVVLTIGGTTFNCPMTLTAGSHKVEREELQMQDVTFKLRGLPTAPTGSTLIALIALGSASIQYAVDTGGSVEEGYALMVKATLQIQDAALVSSQFEFQGQGFAVAEA